MSRRLVLSYLSIAAFVLLVLEVPLGLTYERRAEENLYADIERDARVLATDVEDRLESGGGPDPTATVVAYAEDTGGRAIVLDSTGIAIADSDTTQPPGRDFSTRPEIIDALEGRLASGTRPSDTPTPSRCTSRCPLRPGVCSARFASRICAGARLAGPPQLGAARAWLSAS
jgi:hypothetical protein